MGTKLIFSAPIFVALLPSNHMASRFVINKACATQKTNSGSNAVRYVCNPPHSETFTIEAEGKKDD